MASKSSKNLHGKTNDVTQRTNRKQRMWKKSTQKTKITAINADCLANIFGYLKIDDLLHSADANISLRTAAASEFARKYRKKIVKLIDIHPEYRELHSQKNTLTVAGLKKCLQFLRCFGQSIAKLNISFVNSSEKHHSNVDHYINNYCAVSLVELKVYGRSTIWMKHLQKPFSGKTNFSGLNKYNSWPEFIPETEQNEDTSLLFLFQPLNHFTLKNVI